MWQIEINGKTVPARFSDWDRIVTVATILTAERQADIRIVNVERIPVAA